MRKVILEVDENRVILAVEENKVILEGIVWEWVILKQFSRITIKIVENCQFLPSKMAILD